MLKIFRTSVFLSTGLACLLLAGPAVVDARGCRYEYNTAPAMIVMLIPTSHPTLGPCVLASSVRRADALDVCSLLSVDAAGQPVLALYTASFAASNSDFRASSFR